MRYDGEEAYIREMCNQLREDEREEERSLFSSLLFPLSPSPPLREGIKADIGNPLRKAGLALLIYSRFRCALSNTFILEVFKLFLDSWFYVCILLL